MSIPEILSLIKQKEFVEALERIHEEQTFFPTHALLQRSEIFCLFKLHRVKKARELCEKHFESQKNEAFFISTYLQILEKLGENDEIRLLTERVFSKGPTEARLFKLIARLLCGHPERGDYKTFIAQAANLFPTEPAFQEKQNRQNDYRHYKEYYDKMPVRDAIDEMESLLVMPQYQKDSSLRLVLAEFKKEIKDYEDARKIYEDLLAEEHSLFVVKMLGFLLKKEGKDSEALPYLKEAFVENPSDVVLRKNFTQLCERMEEKGLFIESVRQALQKHPEDRYLYGLLRKAAKWKEKES